MRVLTYTYCRGRNNFNNPVRGGFINTAIKFQICIFNILVDHSLDSDNNRFKIVIVVPYFKLVL